MKKTTEHWRKLDDNWHEHGVDDPEGYFTHAHDYQGFHTHEFSAGRSEDKPIEDLLRSLQ